MENISHDQLQKLIDDRLWKLDPVFHAQLQDRALELEDGGLGFDDDDFWFGEQDYLTPAEVEELLSGEFPQVGGANSGFDFDKDILISQPYNQYVNSFNTTTHSNDVKFQNTDKITDTRTFCTEVLGNINDRLLDGVAPGAMVSLQIGHPGLQKNRISFPPMRRDNLNSETMAQRIEDVLQSNTEFNLDEGMTWTYTIVEDGEGAGIDEKRKADLNWDHPGRQQKKYRCQIDPFIQDLVDAKSSCLIRIENNDFMCLARALVTAKCRVEYINDPDNADKRRMYDNVRKGDKNRYTQQKKQALKLMKDAGLEGHKGPCGLAELAQLHSQLKYRINVHSSAAKLASIYCEGTGPQLDLLHHNKHFHVITSLPGLFNSTYYCHICGVGYNDAYQHTICGGRCGCCFEPKLCPYVSWHLCDICNRGFRNAECYERHLVVRKTYSVCTDVQRCRKCDVLVRTYQKRDHKHQCGKVQCKFCKKEVVISEHYCYIQPSNPPKPLNTRKRCPSFIIFDFEATQDTVVKSTENGDVCQHIVNCVSYEKTCDLCFKQNMDSCTNCGTDLRRTITGDNALDQFCSWVFKEDNKGSYLVAHNSRGYDGQFILRWMQTNTLQPEIIMRGLDIMMLQTGGIRIIDSLNFLPMPLSAFPKALGFKAQKGYFPHYFNTRNTQNYEGPIPPPEDYAIHTMKQKPRAEFEEWYETQQDKKFVMKEELVKYCRMDVEILLEGCMIFRKTCMDKTGIDPFVVAVTLPSLCMYEYRLLHMPLDSIAIVPHQGYRKNDRHSIMGLKYVMMESNRIGKPIQHARNGGEQRVLQYKVDGKVENEMVVYEFYGCVFHGCLACFPDRMQKLPVSNKTAGDAYHETMRRQMEIQAQGYKVHAMWECELKAKLRMPQHRAEKLFFDNINISEPLDPRDAFYGGRTNCRRMYYKCKIGEKMYYIDVCSLYPFILKYGMFPCGHPIIITENFDPIDQRTYNGLIKARVLVPKDLYHPVLPYRSQGKLLFPVCRACADTRNSGPCTHSDNERALEGSWATAELYKAMDKGCRVIHVFEVYHYDKWEQYDGSDEKTGLFTSYVNSHLKSKQEASGWPDWVKTEEDKKEYVRLYKEHEGIDLEPNNIVRNEALRAIEKMFLNAFWGKFGQRSGMSKDVFFTKPAEFLRCVFDPANILESIQIVNEYKMLVKYSLLPEYVEDQPSTNAVMAAIVTPQARLELYKYLEKLGDRVAYMDTDSIIYVSRPGDTYEPERGDFLGQMTDELNGGHIDEFVSLGPKQYAYKAINTDNSFTTVCKIRGMSLNSVISRKIDLYSMRRLILKFLETGEREEIVVDKPFILKNRQWQVVTKIMTKTCKIVYDKCVVLPDGQTVPFGYSV